MSTFFDIYSMLGNISQDEELSRLIADEYASRILRATFEHPLSVQQLSRLCNIPIAVAYRRVGRMEEAGLVKCVGQEEVYRGKKVNYYRCAVKVAKVTFSNGSFSVEIDWIPDADLTMNVTLEAQKA